MKASEYRDSIFSDDKLTWNPLSQSHQLVRFLFAPKMDHYSKQMAAFNGTGQLGHIVMSRFGPTPQLRKEGVSLARASSCILLRYDAVVRQPVRSIAESNSRKIPSLMRCLSSHFGGHRLGDRNSHKTFEFPARKSCIEKRMRIRDEPTAARIKGWYFGTSRNTYG